jgi:hypothetical protein
MVLRVLAWMTPKEPTAMTGRVWGWLPEASAVLLSDEEEEAEESFLLFAATCRGRDVDFCLVMGM